MTSWKACMGRASKNSWATMKGTLSEPAEGQHRTLLTIKIIFLGLVP